MRRTDKSVADRISSRTWFAWIAVNTAIASYFGYAFVAPASSIKTSLLPGRTSHGHYQIELQCAACHEAADDPEQHTAANVLQDACIRCHGEQLEPYDTHPAKKFNDPVNAELLRTIDAQSCLACHQEHVPERTLVMGLTMPADYCWHCHQDVGEHRDSHVGMAFDSCATAGCHNYHDNRAIYEKFLDDHFGQPDHLEDPRVPVRSGSKRLREDLPEPVALRLEQVDAPESKMGDAAHAIEWSGSAHAAAGVNCSGCHQPIVDENGETLAKVGDQWSDKVDMQQCEACHRNQVETFMEGKHGMRLAAGLTPMQPSMARLAMHAGVGHENVTCNSCHPAHRYDTEFAAAEACLECHADSHSMAYPETVHAELWAAECEDESLAGTGVSCATCHLPRRIDDDQLVSVSHNQNAVLRPNETMAREICGHCHGLEYSISALSDASLIKNCFGGPPSVTHPSVQMAHDYFEAKRQKRRRRKNASGAGS